jgi:hypothetical protein
MTKDSKKRLGKVIRIDEGEEITSPPRGVRLADDAIGRAQEAHGET